MIRLETMSAFDRDALAVAGVGAEAGGCFAQPIATVRNRPQARTPLFILQAAQVDESGTSPNQFAKRSLSKRSISRKYCKDNPAWPRWKVSGRRNTEVKLVARSRVTSSSA